MRRFTITPENQDGSHIDAVIWDHSKTQKLVLTDGNPVAVTTAIDAAVVRVQSFATVHMHQSAAGTDATSSDGVNFPGTEPYGHEPGDKISFCRHASATGDQEVYVTPARSV